MLGLMISNLAEEAVSPQKNGVLADTTLYRRFAYAQALGQRLGTLITPCSGPPTPERQDLN